MLRKLLLLITLVFWSAIVVYSQQITGRITTPEDVNGLPGVNILKKGSTIGTTTDIDGKFTLDASKNDTLVISFVGLETVEVAVGNQSVINIVLLQEAKAISEVVVTALGIKRDEKALGYSVQKVSGDQIAKVKELDVVNSLSGKVSGVNIIQADGSIGGGGSRIVIRGETSLAGNNDPLFIINGIPGNSNDIASDDIESISVLKGAAAAALYGSKAGSGVVLITSKSGKKTDGVLVELNSNITFQSPLVLPKYQDKFGVGQSGDYRYNDGNGHGVFDDTHLSWGPAFDGELRSQFTGNKPWVAFPNSVKDFYQTGHIFINNISVSGGTEKSNFRFSYSNTDQKGILPNTGLIKNNLGLNAQFEIRKWLRLSSNVNYIRTKCDNNKQVDVRFIPRGIDISALKNYWVPGMEGYQQMNYRRSANNPYFELFENPFSYVDSKVIANITTNIDITKHLSAMGRFGTNYTNNEYYDKHAYSTYDKYQPLDLGGYYKSGLKNTWDRTAEFLISYDAKFFDALSVKGSFGGTHYRTESKFLEGRAYSLTYLDIYNLNNRKEHIYMEDNIEKQERNSLYAFLNLDYKGKVFLDVTRRDDWSSTLHPTNNHFYYPSVVASALINELFSLPRFISFWKVRGSIAQVGNSIPVPYFTVREKYNFWTSSDGLTHLGVSDTETDPYLSPESTTGTEFGTDMRFFNNRLGIDITYYRSITYNQIVKTDKSVSSGGERFFTTNSGKIRNNGVELTINATPVKLNNLKWDMQLNWSIDRAYVDVFIDSLPDRNYTQQANSFLAIEDRKGQRRGTFFGKAYERAPNGERLYTLSGDTRLTENTQLGNYNPDWMASLNNTLSYKNMSVSFLLDLRYGGLIYNEIERKLNMYGLSEATLLNNREGIVPKGMVEENGTYRELTLADLEKSGKVGGQSGQEYWATQMEETAPQNVLVNDTYLKLRELRIAYELPKKWLSGLTIKSLTIALVGRNLAVWSKVKHVDPETFGTASEKSQFGFDTKVPGYANSNMPSVRSIGFTLSCKF